MVQGRKIFYKSSVRFAELLVQTKGGFFYVPSPVGERLMIPTRYLEELKNSPDEDVDFSGSFLEVSRQAIKIRICCRLLNEFKDVHG